MIEFFDSPRIVDVILVVMVIEAAWIIIHWRVTGRGISFPDLLPNVLAGVFLVLALRVALSDGGWFAMAVFLACAGVAHAVDLSRRWQS